MPMYVTPGRYRTMAFGMDLDGISDIELASVLNRASAVADAYCSVPRLPHPYSFLGGEVTADSPEQHPWRLPENDFDAGSRRIYPYSWPIKSVTQFRVKVTNTQYVDISPSEVFVNNTERYVEVISLQFTGVGLFGAIMPSLGLMRPVAQICYTYGFHYAVEDEFAYPVDLRVYRAQSQFWDPGVPPVVKVDGVVQTSGYTFDITEGTVTFGSTQSPDAMVQISYTHRLPYEVRDAVGAIASYLFGLRETRQRGMSDVNALKVEQVSISKHTGRQSSSASSASVASQLAALVPEAAVLLDGLNNWTVR